MEYQPVEKKTSPQYIKNSRPPVTYIFFNFFFVLLRYSGVLRFATERNFFQIFFHPKFFLPPCCTQLGISFTQQKLSRKVIFATLSLVFRDTDGGGEIT